MNQIHRPGNLKRWGIAEVKNLGNSKAVACVVLGHEDRDAIFMGYDTREALGLKPGEKGSFSFRRLGILGKLCWYLKTPDPAVHLPAWLSLLSVVLGLLGVVLGVISLSQ